MVKRNATLHRFKPNRGCSLHACARRLATSPTPEVDESHVQREIKICSKGGKQCAITWCIHAKKISRTDDMDPCCLGAGFCTPRVVLEKFAAIQIIDVHVPPADGRQLLLARYIQPG